MSTPNEQPTLQHGSSEFNGVNTTNNGNIPPPPSSTHQQLPQNMIDKLSQKLLSISHNTSMKSDQQQPKQQTHLQLPTQSSTLNSVPPTTSQGTDTQRTPQSERKSTASKLIDSFKSITTNKHPSNDDATNTVAEPEKQQSRISKDSLETAKKILTNNGEHMQADFTSLDLNRMLETQPNKQLFEIIRSNRPSHTEFGQAYSTKAVHVRSIMRMFHEFNSLPKENAILLAVQFHNLNTETLHYISTFMRALRNSVLDLNYKVERLELQNKKLMDQQRQRTVHTAELNAVGTQTTKDVVNECQHSHFKPLTKPIGHSSINDEEVHETSVDEDDFRIFGFWSPPPTNNLHPSSLKKSVAFKVELKAPPAEEESEPESPEATSSAASTDTEEEEEAYKLLATTTPTYSGKASEDLESWIFAVNQGFYASRIRSNRLKLAQISNFVKGTPQMLLRNFVTSNAHPKIDKFYALLRQSAPIENRVQNLKLKFLDLKQNEAGNFEHFKEKFLSLLLQINSSKESYTDSEAIFLFTRACRPQLQFELNSRAPKTLDAAIAIATDYEQKLSSAKTSERVNFAPSKSKHLKGKGKRHLICAHCGQNGHSVHYCPTRNASRGNNGGSHHKNGRNNYNNNNNNRNNNNRNNNRNNNNNNSSNNNNANSNKSY